MAAYKQILEVKTKQLFADFLSFVSFSLSSTYDCDSLVYLLEGTRSTNFEYYGGEYIINLGNDITKQYERLNS